MTLFGPLPLFLDRWLAPRLPGFASTLVFPLAWAALDFFNASTNPMPISASPYGLYSDLVLLQLISLTGIWGLSFLSAWLGGLSISDCGKDRSMLSGVVQDQAAVYGIIARMRDYGFQLCSVKIDLIQKTKIRLML